MLPGEQLRRRIRSTESERLLRLVVGARPVQAYRRRALSMWVQQPPQERDEIVGHLRGLLAELPEKNPDVALVDAEVSGKIVGWPPCEHRSSA